MLCEGFHIHTDVGQAGFDAVNGSQGLVFAG